METQWAAALKLSMPLLPSVRVCSKHFKNEDLVVAKDGRRFVRKEAIPIALEGVDEADLSFSPEGKRKKGRYCHICGKNATEEGNSFHRYEKLPNRLEVVRCRIHANSWR